MHVRYRGHTAGSPSAVQLLTEQELREIAGGGVLSLYRHAGIYGLAYLALVTEPIWGGGWR